MKLDTPLSKKLGLRYPFVAAPMFIISNREMIVACAEAGVLGCMPSLNARTAEKLREDLAWIRARTDRPFGINLTLGLTPKERIEQDFALCIEFEVPVLLSSYGNPTELVKRAHEHKMLVFHDVISLAHGKKAVAAGVDAIIGVSAGAGGHAGRISPYVLIPWLKEELKVPILAAGCISDGRQIVASLSLGAELCYIGTRFIASTECGASDAYKEKVVAVGPEDILYTDQISGIHANFIKDTVPEGFTPDRTPEGSKRWKEIWSAGQGVGLIHEIKPISAIVEDLAREAHDVLKGFG
ncbi:NAD(P)H-dependent flavin oxidoreductase [Chondromyces crocatus]|uniref:2-nitropropane dioxygenase n=1 Tax=Chondromyces crocatus TaxID=52 RepID=A0A0K1ENN2_CHOCO|nr:nitronate monooxygenase [Chondromyces crocatus]AKT42540.1 2-nitropropane dioxygenase [Chondromyces crocatus]